MKPATINSLHDDLLADIFCRVGYSELWSRSPLEEVCRRWRHVYSTSPQIWGRVDRFDLSQLADMLDQPPVARAQAVAVVLGRLRRRAPGLRGLELWDVQEDTLDRCSITPEAVLAQLSAAPLQRLDMQLTWASRAIWARLEEHAATLTQLLLQDDHFATAAVQPGRGPCVGWDVAAAHLASLQQLRHCILQLVPEEGDSPATLLAALGSLSNLEWLHLTLEVQQAGSDGQQQQQQQQQQPVTLAVDLGPLAVCRRLQTLQLEVRPLAEVGAEVQPYPAFLQAKLSLQAAQQLSALQSLALLANSVTADEALHLDQLASLQQLKLVDGPVGVAWHCAALTSLTCWRCLIEGPAPVAGDAGVLPRLRQLKLHVCAFPGNRLPDSLFHLRCLTELYLDMCPGSFAAYQRQLPQAVTQLTSLRSLRLCANDLQQVPSAVLQLTGLLRLQLDWNALEELPEGLTALQRLQVLQLCGNRLTGVPSVLYRLPSLLLLDLSNTLVRPSHFNLEEVEQRNFMPDEKDTYIFLGVDRDGETENIEWSSDDFYQLTDLEELRQYCSVRLSLDRADRECKIKEKFAKFLRKAGLVEEADAVME